MMFSPMGEFRDNAASFIEKAQGSLVVVMKHGHPVAVVQGVAGLTIEEVMNLFKKDEKDEKDEERRS
jgi:PHD/YefM family antitoxin component YafN of YafNO toxin-antitoxin module